jgi:ubiquinone/menaquinone biosynthesis C-methylase UbiE
MTANPGAEEFFKSNVEDYKTEHYESGYRSFMSVRQARYLDEIDKLSFAVNDPRVIEAGCGPGYMASALAARHFRVSAFDTSDGMLELTRRLFAASQRPEPELKLGSIEAVPFVDASFDLYVSAGVIEYLETDDRALAEAYRVLAPGGYLVVSITNRFSHAGLFDSIVEAVKRQSAARALINRIFKALDRRPIRAREFRVRKHAPREFRQSVAGAGFNVLRDGYFHFLPLPHPFDRLFPSMSDRLSRRLDGLADSKLRILGEGYYIVGQKSG